MVHLPDEQLQHSFSDTFGFSRALRGSYTPDNGRRALNLIVDSQSLQAGLYWVPGQGEALAGFLALGGCLAAWTGMRASRGFP